MFKSVEAVEGLYASLVHHAMRVSDSASVMRYLGRRNLVSSAPHEVISDYRRRYEGIRVRHSVNYNSVKMYNKSGSLLRKWLYGESEQAEKDQQKKYSGRVTRRIKLLRVHGLIRKAPRTNRYVLTEKGQKFSCSLMTASALDIKALTEMAA
ncbi:MAG: hypothetical protein U0586_00800 [Candidatus Brocadiaceae bacterium]